MSSKLWPFQSPMNIPWANDIIALMEIGIVHENIQYIKRQFAPISSSSACGIIDAFPAVWNHLPTDHYPPTVAPRKAHLNALAGRCR